MDIKITQCNFPSPSLNPFIDTFTGTICLKIEASLKVLNEILLSLDDIDINADVDLRSIDCNIIFVSFKDATSFEESLSMLTMACICK